MTELCLIDLGDLGIVEIEQADHGSFLEKCCDSSDDSTGLRAYSGSHVFCRFLCAFAERVFCDDGVEAIEIGGGVALNTIALTRCRNAKYKTLICSDGNQRAVDIATKNLRKEGHSRISAVRLLWDESEVGKFMAKNTRERFGVVYGSELCYYQTDIEGLVKTVLKLVGYHHESLFVSTHIFRVDGQEELLIEACRRFGDWEVYAVPIDDFVTAVDLAYNPSWYNSRTLVCGHQAFLQRLVGDFGWRRLSEVLKKERLEEEQSAQSFFMHLDE